MNTNEMQCRGCGVKHKKFLIVLGLVSLAIAGVIVGMIGFHERYSNNYNMMGSSGGYGKYGRGVSYAVPTPAQDFPAFNVPQDGAKKGEIAITVDSIESAKKNVADAAAKNDGSVYASFISYSSNDIKNGSMIIQVPIEKFDSAFADLRNVGRQVVQESIQQIEKRNIYPMMNQSVPAALDDQATNIGSAQSSQEKKVDVVEPAIAIAPTSIVAQVQDKGYIKIVFANYVAPKATTYSDNRGFGSMMNNQYAAQDVRKVLLIGFAIKLVFLLVLIFLLGYVFKKIIHNLRISRRSDVRTHTRQSEKKSVAHVVRQSRSSIVNTKKK